MEEIEFDEVLTAEEAAFELGIPLGHLQIICKNLLFRKDRLSHRYRISKSHLKRLKEIMAERFY